MAKPDPTLLEPGRYPFSCEIAARFADLDLNQHINNVAVAGLFEEGRVRFNAAWGLAHLLDGVGAMIANVAIDYLAQAYYPQPLRGFAAVERIGGSSWTMVQLLLQEERVVAFSRAVLVCVSAEGSAPLSGPLREGLEGMRLL